MRIELIPVIIGALLALAGLFLAADAILPEGAFVTQERRRRERSQRNRPGELSIAIGMFCMAAALIGRDTWRFSTIAAVVGVVALAIGSVLNLGFLKEYLFHRGAARRGAPQLDQPRSAQPPVGVHAVSRTEEVKREQSIAHAARRAEAANRNSPGDPSRAEPRSSIPGPADRAPDQPTTKPKMRDNRKYPRG